MESRDCACDESSSVELYRQLSQSRRRWLVTGAAGFIGSHLVERLLKSNQEVVGLDNFSTGSRANLELVKLEVGEERWKNFRLIEGDIRDLVVCREACSAIEFVLHQAALGSVPRSLADPLGTHDNNVNGFVNMLVSSRDAGVNTFVYASSSSVYGDSSTLPKREPEIGRPLSPYALSKSIDEQYASIFHRCFGLNTVGLRYFNVFGPRQDPAGAYAAVIPRWIGGIMSGQPVTIYGDGSTSRDFSFVDNIALANVLAATQMSPEIVDRVFNIAVGGRTTLLELFEMIRVILEGLGHLDNSVVVNYQDERPGDIRHSIADISRAREVLSYHPLSDVRQGLQATVEWFLKR